MAARGHKFVIAVLISGPAMLAGAAKAETLPVDVLYPAGVDRAAALNSLSVQRFTGEHGQTLAFEIEQKLRAARLGGQPYFTFPANGADGRLTGHATSNVVHQAELREQMVCVRQDDRGKCLAERKVVVECQRRVVTFSYNFTLDDARGNQLFADGAAREASYLICPNSRDVPTVDATVRYFIDDLSSAIRLAFAPVDGKEEVRVLEGTRGLRGDAQDLFKDGVKATTRNVRSACDMWREVDALVPDHVSTVFNLGLCAESEGDFATAESFYDRVLDLDRRQDYAEKGLQRLQARQHAERQIASRGGGKG